MNKIRWTAWILDIVVAVLAVLSVACYFFGAYWTLQFSYQLPVKQLLTSLNMGDVELKKDGEIIETIPVSLGVDIETTLLFTAFNADVDQVVTQFLDTNVDKVVNQVMVVFDEYSKPLIQSVAKQMVKEEVHRQAKEIFRQNNTGITDEEVSERLAAANIDDEYIEETLDQLVDVIFSEDASIDTIGDQVIDTIDEVFEKLRTAGDEDFENIYLTEEDKEAVRESVGEALSEIADENGDINVDDFIDQMLLLAVQAMNGSANAGVGAIAVAAEEGSDSETPAIPAPADKEETRAQLKEELRKVIIGYLFGSGGEQTARYLLWVLYGLFGLFALSALAWCYILIKLLVKLLSNSRNNTVKLKAVIWLGWLPYFILVALPSLLLWLVNWLPATFPALAETEFFTSVLSFLGQGYSFSFASIGWIPALSAGICFAISIVFMVLRRKIKRHKDEPVQHDDKDYQREAATADDLQ